MLVILPRVAGDSVSSASDGTVLGSWCDVVNAESTGGEVISVWPLCPSILLQAVYLRIDFIFGFPLPILGVDHPVHCSPVVSWTASAR